MGKEAVIVIAITSDNKFILVAQNRIDNKVSLEFPSGYIEDGETYISAAPKGIVKNSVGAGDSMVAGFVAGYSKTKDYEYALRLGICTGSASAFSSDLATKEEVEELMKKQFDSKML